jgi:hypothetical protein
MIQRRRSKQERADELAIITQGNLCLCYNAVLGDMYAKQAPLYLLNLLRERKLYHDNKVQEMRDAFDKKWRKDDSKQPCEV